MDAEFMNDNKAHKLILGGTFKHHANTAFHTVRCELIPWYYCCLRIILLSYDCVPLKIDDFKPASVDQNQEGELEVGEANEITVTLPNVQQSKTACTVYKGSKKPIQKECVLIYDKVTGEFTLEKIASQIQVKKTRYDMLNILISVTIISVSHSLLKDLLEMQTSPLFQPQLLLLRSLIK